MKKRKIKHTLKGKSVKQRGKFIVIEGVDGGGKTVQYNLLYKRLKKVYPKVRKVDFPRYYDSVWGKMVGEFLIGRYGKFNEVDAHLIVLPYMLDQYVWSRDLGRKWIKEGDIIISNRYFTSNVHQIAKLKGRAKITFSNWLWQAGYKHLGILKPDLVVFLDVAPEVSKRLNKKKSERGYLNGRRKKDLAESNFIHQKLAYREYIRMVKDTNYWVRIKCCKRGKIDTPEDIHERVWGVISNRLNLG